MTATLEVIVGNVGIVYSGTNPTEGEAMGQIIFGNGNAVFEPQSMESDPIMARRAKEYPASNPIRCAAFCPGGIQCQREMYHAGNCDFNHEHEFSIHTPLRQS